MQNKLDKIRFGVLVLCSEFDQYLLDPALVSLKWSTIDF